MSGKLARSWPRLLLRMTFWLLGLIGLALVTLLAIFYHFINTRPMSTFPQLPSENNAEQVGRLLNVGKALFVGAHPDDIEFYSAGLVYLMRKNGVQVTFAVATRGGKGREGRALERLESLRSSHQRRSAEILGGAHVELYHYPDKNLSWRMEDFAEDLKALIREEKPDVVLSWDPDFIFNPHADHQAASRAARIAAADAGVPVVFYGTREPNLWVGFGKDVFKAKYRSLRAHRTEAPWPYSVWVKRLQAKKGRGEGRKIGHAFAEVFRIDGDFSGVAARTSPPAPTRECSNEQDMPEET